MAVPDRITTHPLVLNGRPCLRGSRVTVANILRLMAAGYSNAVILETYPHLEQADLDACVAYAARPAESAAAMSFPVARAERGAGGQAGSGVPVPRPQRTAPASPARGRSPPGGDATPAS